MNSNEIIFSTPLEFEEEKSDVLNPQKKHGLVHIRMQKRNARQSITTVSGLAPDLDLKKILKCLRKVFYTNGAVIKDKEDNEVIQIQGDQRENIAKFFIKYKVCEEDDIKIHGV